MRAKAALGGGEQRIAQQHAKGKLTAREASVGPTLEEALKKLPEREYSGPEDLTQALNAAA